MILNPDVAAVLDKAAENISETDVVPTKLVSCGAGKGDPGFDALSAVAYALIELGWMDQIEINSNHPHLGEIMAVVADFGTVPEAERESQDMRFEVGGYPMDKVLRRMRRADDMIMWGRGRQSSEVAQLFRWAADEFRSRPANEGVYPPEGYYEANGSRNGVFLDVIKSLAKSHAEGSPHGPIPTMAIMSMIETVLTRDATPDPDVAVVVRREDVPAARIAEIAQGVIDLINEQGWTDTFLFHPETGAVSIRGAAALLADLPPRMDYLVSKVHKLERRWAELWAFDEAVADFLGLPTETVECRGCGKTHSDDRLGPWENDGRTVEEIVAALTGVRNAYVTLAASDSLGSEDVDWESFTAMLDQS